MHSVQDRKKHYLLFILLMSFLLALTFPGLAKAETETASTGAANAVTVSTQTASPAPAASEATSSVKTSTEAASVANDVPNSGKTTSAMSPSGDNTPSLSPAEKPQANQTPASEKPDVTEVSTEKVQAGDASQAEKDAKEKATASATDKEKTQSGDASQAEKEAIEKDATGIADKEKASAGDPAQAEEETVEKDTASIADKEKASTDDPAQAEEENPEAIDAPQVDAGITENKDPSQLKNETAEALPSAKEAEVLEKGETLEVEALAKTPMALGAGAGNPENIVEVTSFEGLKKAIADAGTEPTTIVITKSITLKKTLTIGSDQNITITSGADRSKDNNKVTPIGEDTIDLPTNKDNTVESRENLVTKAEEKGKKALKDTDLSKNKNPLPEVDYVLKRDETFTGTLITIEKGGTLTLGKDKEDPLFIDGNKEVKTEIEHGSFIDVNGKLLMNGGFIANGNNYRDESAPIYVGNGGKFTMEGGRITSNRNISKGFSTFNAAGGVYVDEGGTFTLNGGSIDNNHAPVGGVFLGKISGNTSPDRKWASFTMNGGYIARNVGPLFSDENSDIQYYAILWWRSSCRFTCKF